MPKKITTGFVVALTLALSLVCLSGCSESKALLGLLPFSQSSSVAAVPAYDSIVGDWCVDSASIGGMKMSADQLGSEYNLDLSFTDDGQVTINAQGDTYTVTYEVGSDGVLIFGGQAAQTEGFSLAFKDGQLSMDMADGAATIMFRKV